MTINELKKMSESKMMEWVVNTNAKDLGLLLQYEGVKGVSKMKKAEIKKQGRERHGQERRETQG